MTDAEKQAAEALAAKTATDAATAAKAASDADKAKALAYEVKDFKLPRGSPGAPEDLERIVSFSKARGLSKEVVQNYVDLEHEEALEDAKFEKQEEAKAAEAQTKKLDETKQRFASELFADPEFGGGNKEQFAANSEVVKRGLVRIFGQEFVNTYAPTGILDIPKFVKGIFPVAKLMAEDKLHLGGTNPQTGQKKSDAELFYNADAR